MEKCIGCELCAGVCPADCIYVRGADNPPDDPVSPGERYGFVYEINYLRCIHCDLCVEACPTEAITESKLFEFSFTNRADAIYTKDELLVDDDGRPQQLPWEDWREGDDLHTSAWMRATSPVGQRRLRGPGAVVGRARLRGPRPRGRPERRARRRGHRQSASSARRSRPISTTSELPPDQRGMRGSPSDRAEEQPAPPPARARRSSAAAAGPSGRPAPTVCREPHDEERVTIAAPGRRHHRRSTALTFAIAASIVLIGAIGVVMARNPVHAALMLVMTLFGVAVLVRRPAGQLPGRRAGHRLRRRHRRAVPVRDHVPRRRPRGEPRRGAAAGPAPARHRARSS